MPFDVDFPPPKNSNIVYRICLFPPLCINICSAKIYYVLNFGTFLIDLPFRFWLHWQIIWPRMSVGGDKAIIFISDILHLYGVTQTRISFRGTTLKSMIDVWRSGITVTFGKNDIYQLHKNGFSIDACRIGISVNKTFQLLVVCKNRHESIWCLLGYRYCTAQ